MKMKALIAAVVLSISTITASASVYKLPTTTIDGKEYYYHEVKAKETLYSLSHKLGMSQDEMKKYNPSLAEGLKVGAKLYFPVDELGGGDVQIIHKVEKGETVYGISKQYHITIEQLLQLNPSAQDGIKVGDELKIKKMVDSKPAQQQSQTPVQGDLHIIKSGETLYAIAAKYNTTVEKLLSLNPALSIDKYDVGMVIRVNDKAPLTAQNKVDETNVGVKQTLTVNSRPEYVDEKSQSQAQLQVVEPTKEYNIAVLMPFMLGEEKIDSKTYTFLDFYKGFILAADALKSSGAKINIYAYDTQNSVDSVAVILQDAKLAQMDVIVTPPGSMETVAHIAGMSDSTKSKVFNVFYANDTTHYVHENVIQGNIVRDNMYAKATESAYAHFVDYTPVIINTPKNQNRANIVEAIKAKYQAAGVEIAEVTYKKTLTEADLKNLDKTKKYLFIPLSSSESEFEKYSDALCAFAKDNAENVALFGYPEWTAFGEEKQTKLHAVNTVVYSRFFYNSNGEKEKAFETKFEEVYKNEMRKTPPIQAVMGYDCGYYLINALRHTQGESYCDYKYEGLQYAFDFAQVEGVKGLENQSLFLIFYRHDGSVERVKK